MSDVSVHTEAVIPPAGPPQRRGRGLALLLAVVAGLAAIILVYSQTLSFAWDEGFHLLAAQLDRPGAIAICRLLFSADAAKRLLGRTLAACIHG